MIATFNLYDAKFSGGGTSGANCIHRGFGSRVGKANQVNTKSASHDFGAIGRMPRVGDGISGNGYRLCVEELDGRRVSVVRYVPTSEMVTTAK